MFHVKHYSPKMIHRKEWLFMNRKDLFNRLYNELLMADVLNIFDYNTQEDLNMEVMEIIEKVFRDFIIVQGDVLS